MSITTVDTSATRARIDDKNFTAPHADQTIHDLRTKLEDHRRRSARNAGWVRRFVPTGLKLLDRALPHGGLPCGAITEILSHGSGVGAMTLAMRIADRQTGPSDHRKIVVVDTLGDFYPPAARQHGLTPDRLIVIRPANREDAFWAAAQSLRCAAVAAVIAPLDRLDSRLSRQLQLAVESCGSLGLILRPMDRSVRGFAAVQLLVEGVREGDLVGRCSVPHPSPSAKNGAPVSSAPTDGAPERTHPSPERKRRVHAPATIKQPPIACAQGSDDFGDSLWCRITLLRVREGMPAEPVLVDLHHETGALPLPSLPVNRQTMSANQQTMSASQQTMPVERPVAKRA